MVAIAGSGGVLHSERGWSDDRSAVWHCDVVCDALHDTRPRSPSLSASVLLSPAQSISSTHHLYSPAQSEPVAAGKNKS